jgi:hypothetical protein
MEFMDPNATARIWISISAIEFPGILKYSIDGCRELTVKYEEMIKKVANGVWEEL